MLVENNDAILSFCSKLAIFVWLVCHFDFVHHLVSTRPFV